MIGIRIILAINVMIFYQIRKLDYILEKIYNIY
jgi:hypothetical protein